MANLVICRQKICLGVWHPLHSTVGTGLNGLQAFVNVYVFIELFKPRKDNGKIRRTNIHEK